MSETRTFLLRYRPSRLLKSKAGAASVVVKRGATPKPPTLQAGAFIRVQRPDHPTPLLGRVAGVGKDGVRMTTDDGRVVSVRHQHIQDRQPPISGKERAAWARAAAERGIEQPIEDRLLMVDGAGNAPRRVTASQQRLLDELMGHGVPIDPDGLRDATYDDAQSLLDRYIEGL